MVHAQVHGAAEVKITPELEQAVLDNDEEKTVALVEASSLTRKCGSCVACCIYLGVEEIKKDHGVRCEHLVRHKGCGIYDTRPKQCKNFYCLWKLGLGSRKDSPDDIGVVFDAYEKNGQPVLRAAETREGSMSPGTRGWAFAQKLMVGHAASILHVMRKDGSRSIYTL
jgi:hypothetical protein